MELPLPPPTSERIDPPPLFAVIKDVIDIAGEVTGAGNPTWAATHGPAPGDASCVARLRAAGVRIAGKATCAEFAYSLSGDNAHYGMPPNPAAPDRNPGGSSSGSASAVAAGECDIGVGTDTLGSIRIPASYCGLFGFRPTHGRIDTAGVLPLAPSFDTVGLLAATGPVLRAAADVLLDSAGTGPCAVRCLRLAGDALDLADDAVRPSLDAAARALGDTLGSSMEVVDAFGDTTGFAHALEVFSIIQGFEVWRQYGTWIERNHPDFGPGVAERFAGAARIDAGAYAAALREREDLRARLIGLLDGDALLALPAAGGLAPLRIAGADELQRARLQAGRMSCLATLAGCPSISLPTTPVDGVPVGLAVIAAPRADATLLSIAAHWPRTHLRTASRGDAGKATREHPHVTARRWRLTFDQPPTSTRPAGRQARFPAGQGV